MKRSDWLHRRRNQQTSVRTMLGRLSLLTIRPVIECKVLPWPKQPKSRLWSGVEPSAGPEMPALTPAQLQLRKMVLDSVTSPHSRRTYAKGLDLLFAFAANRPLTRALLMEYRTSMEDLAPSTVNVRLTAVRKMVTEAKRNGLLSADEAASLTDVPNVRQSGNPAWNWLSKEQARNCWPFPIAPR